MYYFHIHGRRFHFNICAGICQLVKGGEILVGSEKISGWYLEQTPCPYTNRMLSSKNKK